jgi:TolB-like protein
LPFQNLSGDPEQEYFVDGMVEEITTAIARLPWLFVIARNSSFTYKGRSVDVKQVGRGLGVRYVLEGSVRKAGNRVRITGQLIDATTGAHLWAERFDGALDDIFELQDSVAASVAGAIEPKLRRAEIERASRKPMGSLDAFDLYLRALAQYYRRTEESLRAAVALCERALETDPGYPPAAALIGCCRHRQTLQGWGPVSPVEVAEAVRLVRQAIETGKDDPDTLSMGALALSQLAGDHGIATAAADRALTLNPNSAPAWMARGWIRVWVGQPGPAIEAFENAMRLSPLDPMTSLFTGGTAYAHALAGRYEAAIPWADRSLSERPTYTAAMRLKAAAYMKLDRIAEAQDCVRRLLEIDPGLTIAKFASRVTVFARPEFADFLIDGLRQAGLPEE